MTEGHVAEDDEDIFWKVLACTGAQACLPVAPVRQCSDTPLTMARSHGGEGLDGFSTSATLGYRPLVVRWTDEGLPGGGNPGR